MQVTVSEMVQIGIGLRQPHYAELLENRPELGFVEVHSENFFADGGAALAVLRGVRSHYDVSLHGVGLALGSATGVDSWHLERLARLVQRIEPVRVSDHACFGRAAVTDKGPVMHANDLLPLAFTPASLVIMENSVTLVQERLRRPLLVENLSAYLWFDDADQLSEPAFFAELCQRTGCQMLLDVNNLMVNALNAHAADPVAACCGYIDQLPAGIVGEIHLAGYCENTDFDMVIDDHGSRVRDAVWSVYEHALSKFAPVPALVEWDTGLPTLEVLLDEAAHAARLQAA